MNIAFIIVGSLVGIFIIYVIYSYIKLKRMPDVATSSKVIKLNDQNFKQHTKSGLVLVDFWAEWCMPCKMMNPVINQLAEEKEGEVKVAKLNVEHAKATAAKMRVKNIPTMIIFKNGREAVRMVGAKSKDQIIKQLNELK